MNTYDVGDLVTLSAAFKVNGFPTNPTTLTVTVRKPDGSQSNPVPTNPSAGNYLVSLTPAAGEVGDWWYGFVGTGAAQDTQEGVFRVRPRQATAAAGTLLCGLGDLENLIQVQVPAEGRDAALAAIAAASAAIRGYCHQVLSLVTDDHVVLSPSCGRVLLPELPVVAVSAVSLAGVALAAGAYGFEAATGELLRFDPLATPPPWPIWWDSGFRNIAVAYTHGYATLPDDLVNVCARVASRQYLGGLRSALVGPHARESDYSAVYQGEPIGETAGAYGPTSAVILTGDEKRTLTPYRVQVLG